MTPYTIGITEPFAARSNAAPFADRIALGLLLASVFFLPSDLRVVDGKSLTFIFGFTSLIFALYAMLRRWSWTPPGVGMLLISGFVVWSTSMLAWTPYPVEGHWKVLQYWR